MTTKTTILAAVLLGACAGTMRGAQQFPVIATATINAPVNQITIIVSRSKWKRQPRIRVTTFIRDCSGTRGSPTFTSCITPGL
jgi:hypothetical protein